MKTEPPPARGATQSVVPTLLALLVLVPLASLSPWTVSAGLIGLCGVYVAFEFALVKISVRTLERVAGGLLLDHVADALSLREHVAADVDVDTIGGLVLERLGRQPAPGDHVELAAYKVVVEDASGFRISRLGFEPLEPAAPPTAPAA